MTENKQIENESDGLHKLILVVGATLIACGAVCFRGLKAVNLKNFNLYIGLMSWFSLSGIIVLKDYGHLRFLDYLLFLSGFEEVFYNFRELGVLMNALFLFLMPLLTVLFFLGLLDLIISRKYQNTFKKLGIKNSLKEEPKVHRVIKLDEDRKLLKIVSPGLGPHEWEKRKENLSFAFKADIDEIKISDDRNFIDILISENQLPKVVSYNKYEDSLKEPFSFIVGESKQRLVTESIRNCPHLLMGGATGMGKSTAFKLMLYSLLKSSPEEQISFNLLDLKRGVEVADFEGFPNVKISKNEVDAVSTLKKISNEMHSRYRHLEKNKNVKIDPKRDKLPLIIVAVDEASVIFGSRSQSSSKKNLADEARELCEEIAKLGRAAGIHMMLATQRATKTSIDTVTLDNLEARLCFRTRSVSGSTAILGDKSGTTIPDVPGRAIWQKGVESVKLQVPFITENALTKLCDALKRERIGDEENNELNVQVETENDLSSLAEDDSIDRNKFD